MKVLVDIKNIAIFGSGISAFILPILNEWCERRKSISFFFTGPINDKEVFKSAENLKLVNVPFPEGLPRYLRHPVYDNVKFSMAVRKVNPDLIFTPYHDVRLPKNIPSVMMIHDTCIGDLNEIYPYKVRCYYEYMLQVNLKRCKEIFTVSNASKQAIVDRYSYPAEKISVIYNTVDNAFLEQSPNSKDDKKSFNILYTGGNEYRKNVERLLDAFECVLKKHAEAKLLITGGHQQAWQKCLTSRSAKLKHSVHMLGKLNINQLANAYKDADVVVYPSLCEGFGRACLEAMAVGTPIACSDLPVLREVAGGYGYFFDPYSPSDIAEKVIQARNSSDVTPMLDDRFKQSNVIDSFISQMDKVLEVYANE